MKKIIALVLSLVLVLSLGLTFVSAAELNEYEQEVMDKLGTKEVYKGLTYSFPENYVKMAENFYLDYDLTEEQKDQIIPLLDRGYEIMVSYKEELNGKDNLFEIMPREHKKELLDLAAEAGKVVGLTVTYDGKLLHAVDEEGYSWLSNEPMIKVTGGADYTMIIVALAAVAFIAVASAAVFVVKRSRA